MKGNILYDNTAQRDINTQEWI